MKLKIDRETRQLVRTPAWFSIGWKVALVGVCWWQCEYGADLWAGLGTFAVAGIMCEVVVRVVVHRFGEPSA